MVDYRNREELGNQVLLLDGMRMNRRASISKLFDSTDNATQFSGIMGESVEQPDLGRGTRKRQAASLLDELCSSPRIQHVAKRQRKPGAVRLADGISDPFNRAHKARVVRLPHHSERSREVGRPSPNDIHTFRRRYGVDFLEGLRIFDQNCQQDFTIRLLDVLHERHLPVVGSPTGVQDPPITQRWIVCRLDCGTSHRGGCDVRDMNPLCAKVEKSQD